MNIKAYAKINLTLDILGIRPDGFHSLSSVMVPVSLCDRITVEENSGFSFDCSIKELCTADNLCVRAAKLFFATANIAPNVSVYLEKNIPFPAGLGGGSSDAAAVLKGLNAFFGHPLSDETLFGLAAQLGSDVPFCLLSKPALCEGRGEILTPLEGIPEMNTVIAVGQGRLPTPQVYREYDSAKLPPRRDSAIFISAVGDNDIAKAVSALGNAFEPVADILAPETKLQRERMIALDAKASHLSGSGPSVYGVFENEAKAEFAAKILKKEGYFAVSCKTLI